MTRDTLSDAVGEIEEYQRDMPDAYLQDTEQVRAATAAG